MYRTTLALLNQLCLDGYLGEILINVEGNKSTICVATILNKCFVEKAARELNLAIRISVYDYHTCITIGDVS